MWRVTYVHDGHTWCPSSIIKEQAWHPLNRSLPPQPCKECGEAYRVAGWERIEERVALPRKVKFRRGKFNAAQLDLFK